MEMTDLGLYSIALAIALHGLLTGPFSPFVPRSIERKIDLMSAEIDRLTASVANLTTVDDSLVALVGQLAQAIRNNASDPAALNALADSLDTEAQKVSDAVTANTPAAP